MAYPSEKFESKLRKAGFHFQQLILADGMNGYVQGIRPDTGMIIVAHPYKWLKPELRTKKCFWQIVDYAPKDVKPL
jgi:hypothetical protein